MTKKNKENQTNEEINTKEEAKTYEFEAQDGVVETNETTVAKQQYDQLQAQFLRLQADFDNFKKRNQCSTSKAYSDGIEDVITSMLPIMDYLDMAIMAQKDESQRKGIELVKKTMIDILAGYDVVEKEVLGADFDPNFAEAFMSKEDPDNAGKVIEVVKKGFVRKDTVIRHAMVVVAE